MTYEFTPNAQTWPRAVSDHSSFTSWFIHLIGQFQLNEDLGGVPGKIYLILGDTGDVSGNGLDFIDGMSFLERFYYVYDIDNQRVGFAPTTYTYANTN